MQRNVIPVEGKEKKETYLTGYMTVEATLIMPVVLYICVFVLYTGFYLYDRCVMKQDAYRAALRGSSVYSQDNKDVYNATREYLDTIMTDKYIATDCRYSISVRDKVEVNIMGYIDMPFLGLSQLTDSEGWEIAETVDSRCLNPVLFVRMCRQLSEAGDAMTENKQNDE